MKIRPLTLFEKTLDSLFMPIMRIISGAPTEEPQRSHLWNIKILGKADTEHLDRNLMLQNTGIPTGARRSRIAPKHHIPILGGWKQYIVISPKDPASGWFIGWHTKSVTEVSRIELKTPVRMLVAPEEVFFFAFSKSGEQIPIEKIAEGTIGDRSVYSKLPLL